MSDAVVQVKGQILAGPPKSSCSPFPAGFVNIDFTTRSTNKAAAVSAYQSRSLNSPSSFAGLDGVGSGETVTKATFLYLRTATAMTIRLTTDDGSGGSVTAVIPVDGFLLMEFQTAKFLKLVEAQGVGTVEYFASGNE